MFTSINIVSWIHCTLSDWLSTSFSTAHAVLSELPELYAKICDLFHVADDLSCSYLDWFHDYLTCTAMSQYRDLVATYVMGVAVICCVWIQSSQCCVDSMQSHIAKGRDWGGLLIRELCRYLQSAELVSCDIYPMPLVWSHASNWKLRTVLTTWWCHTTPLKQLDLW